MERLPNERCGSGVSAAVDWSESGGVRPQNWGAMGSIFRPIGFASDCDRECSDSSALVDVGELRKAPVRLRASVRGGGAHWLANF